MYLHSLTHTNTPNHSLSLTRTQTHTQSLTHTHTHTVFRAAAQETGPPVPVLAIQPLNLAFMNGNIFSFRPEFIPKQI